MYNVCDGHAVWCVHDCTCIEVCLKEQRAEAALICGPDISASVVRSRCPRFMAQCWPKWALGIENTVSKCVIEVKHIVYCD